MARSVLRVADQVAGAFPERCVLSGIETSRAVRLTATQWDGPRWLLGVPGFAAMVAWLPAHQRCAVSLPLSDRVWKMWRIRTMTSTAALMAGLTFAVIGTATTTIGLAVVGMLVAIGAVAYRTRAHHNFWVTCTLHPNDQTIIVVPTHQQFDAAARELFIRRL